MDHLKDKIFQPYPELLVFLTVSAGLVLGRIRHKAVALGSVTGCLIAGLALGWVFEVEVNGTVKSLFFIMFLFALRQAGWGLLLLGAVATVVPLVVGFAFGYRVLRMRFAILLGVVAGGQTTTAAIGAIDESARSQVPTLGYTIPYAVGNVLLTVWGAVIVLLQH
ncbi:MAG: hypothetical protein HOV94_12450 [Saccharothrix sp.]|nr:hypothetical protein [Saccharothrix sp.]